MNKKELLSMPALLVTDQMRKLVDDDELRERTVKYAWGVQTYSCYDRYLYIRALVKDGILKVCLYARRSIEAGSSLPDFEVYVSRSEKKYATYCRNTGKWLTAKISNLPFDLDNGYYYGNKPWSSDQTRKTVNEYFGYLNAEPKEAVLQYQNMLAGERLKKKHASELEEIDAVMNEVPDLPKDWEEWIYKSAYCRRQYLMYKPGTRKAFCTACGNWGELKIKPRHNELGKCPHCRRILATLSWNKQKSLEDCIHVGIIQQLKDKSGYILRIFGSKIKRYHQGDWKLDTGESRWWEQYRIKLSKDFAPLRIYEYAEYKYTGIIRWCYEKNKGYYYTAYATQTDVVLYHRNLMRIRKEVPALKYIPVEEIFRHKQGCFCYPDEKIRGCIRQPEIEYVIKAGLYNLAWDLASRGTLTVLKKGKKKLWEALGIRKDQMELCRKMDITDRQLEVLQKANQREISLTPEQIEWYTREIGPQLVGDIFVFHKVARHMKYLQELLKENKRAVADYMDYLEDLRKLGIQPDMDVLFPKDFQSMHERTAIQRQEREDRLKKMQIEKKDRLLREMLLELREVYEAGDDDYTVVLPECKEDFNREGRENHNCVGGSYFDKMLEKRCVVFFLRKTGDLENSFCTVEMDGSRIVQCRAIRNSQPPEEVTRWMQAYAEEVGSRILEREEKKAKLIAG